METEDKNIDLNSDKDQKTEEQGKKEIETPKTFTQEQLDKILSERLAKERAKSEEDSKKKLEEALAEERRLAKMNQEQRDKELTEKKAKEIEAQRKDLTIRENKLSGIEKLNELKVPIKFIDFVVNEDAEVMQKNIDSLSAEWAKALTEEIKNLSANEAPEAPNKTKISDSTFKPMSGI